MASQGPEFEVPPRLEKQYQAAIEKLVGKMLPAKLPGETFEAWVKKLAAISLQEDVHEASNLLARQMVAWVNVKNAKTWRDAAQKAQGGRRLYVLLQHGMKNKLGARISTIVRENAQLIRSIPTHAAYQLTDEIMRAQQAGARPTTIAKMMRLRFPKLLRSRVRMIARTETAKASTALTQARCEDLNIQFYIWRTSEDVRVRRSHRLMDGVVVPWSSAPAPEALAGEESKLGHYHAGECPNCRCTQIVVLTLEDIRFPAKVYWQGSIRRMRKDEFQKHFNLERRAA